MNDQIFKGQWKEIQGKLQQQWGRLTDDQFTEIKGNNKKIYGVLQEAYGYSKDEAKEKVSEFLDKLSEGADELGEQSHHLIAKLSTQISHLSDQMKDWMSRGQKVVTEQVQEQPLASVGIALSVGVILGYLLGRD